jgi:hypothetical protein
MDAEVAHEGYREDTLTSPEGTEMDHDQLDKVGFGEFMYEWREKFLTPVPVSALLEVITDGGMMPSLFDHEIPYAKGLGIPVCHRGKLTRLGRILCQQEKAKENWDDFRIIHYTNNVTKAKFFHVVPFETKGVPRLEVTPWLKT